MLEVYDEHQKNNSYILQSELLGVIGSFAATESHTTWD